MNTMKLEGHEQKIIEAYESGESMESLGHLYNVCGQTVGNMLKRFGVTRRKTGPPRIDLPVSEIAKSYQDGQSCRQIADNYECSYATVLRALREHNIERRPNCPPGSDNYFYTGGPVSNFRAQNAVKWALKKGELTRPESCEKCGDKPSPGKDGRSRIQGHHESYERSKWLDVVWLCAKCHKKTHKDIYEGSMS